MTPNNCIVIAKFLTNTQHVELKPLCTGGLAPLPSGSSIKPYFNQGAGYAHHIDLSLLDLKMLPRAFFEAFYLWRFLLIT